MMSLQVLTLSEGGVSVMVTSWFVLVWQSLSADAPSTTVGYFFVVEKNRIKN